ncbi:phosphotransferase [Microtetraspora malaysiensis]|uniref:phosphotransferase n=1 Tax=Microtetraspora malaysiensis TaxID=161358 RepID=UPI00082C3C67|nr:phosphotransferase [Microtetraspora malaysiensis]
MISAAEACDAIEQLFGLRGELTLMGGDRDCNFRLRLDRGTSWMIKFVHPSEHETSTLTQCLVLHELQRVDPTLRLPQPYQPLTGTHFAVWERPGELGLPPVRVRCYSFLTGTPVANVSPGALTRAALGTALATLDAALNACVVPVAEFRDDVLWDVRRLPELGCRWDGYDLDSAAARQLDHVFDHALPAAAKLPQQVIHNDMNPQNILVAEDNPTRVTGIIDFGDLVRASRAQDLATLAAYHVTTQEHPLAGPAQIIRSYHDRTPLLDGEVRVLFDLMLARLVLIVRMSEWMSRRYPGNSRYFLRNNAAARAALTALAEINCSQAADYFRSHLEG